jgi:hypothetical protein
VVAVTNSPGEVLEDSIICTMAVAVETIISMIAGVIMAKVEDRQPTIITIRIIITIILKAVPREATMKLVETITATAVEDQLNGDRQKPQSRRTCTSN